MAAARFTVTKPEEEEVPITETSRDGYGSYDGAHVQHPSGKVLFFTLAPFQVCSGVKKESVDQRLVHRLQSLSRGLLLEGKFSPDEATVRKERLKEIATRKRVGEFGLGC
ncbi:hypothetical protein BaRGS_00009974, partial [Batillaria attramentaria]